MKAYFTSFGEAVAFVYFALDVAAPSLREDEFVYLREHPEESHHVRSPRGRATIAWQGRNGGRCEWNAVVHRPD
jgi:hypothetical protein